MPEGSADAPEGGKEVTQETFLKNYKGFAIYVTPGGRFKAYGLREDGKTKDGDVVDEAGSLDGLQSKLKTRATSVLQKKRALYREEPSSWRYGGSDRDEVLQYIEGAIVEVTVKGRQNYYTVRTGDENGHRDLEMTDGAMYKPTPENLALVKEIVRLWKEERDRRKQREAAEEKLERWTDGELLLPEARRPQGVEVPAESWEQGGEQNP
jgi:hypothetical protein